MQSRKVSWHSALNRGNSTYQKNGIPMLTGITCKDAHRCDKFAIITAQNSSIPLRPYSRFDWLPFMCTFNDITNLPLDVSCLIKPFHHLKAQSKWLNGVNFSHQTNRSNPVLWIGLWEVVRFMNNARTCQSSDWGQFLTRENSCQNQESDWCEDKQYAWKSHKSILSKVCGDRITH